MCFTAVYVARGGSVLKGFLSQEVKDGFWFKVVLKHPVFTSLCHNRKEKKGGG